MLGAPRPGLGMFVTVHEGAGAATGKSIMRITAFDAALELARSSRDGTPTPGASGTSALVLNDAIYFAAWGRLERFRCTP